MEKVQLRITDCLPLHRLIILLVAFGMTHEEMEKAAWDK